jgi:hypothetical protein
VIVFALNQGSFPAVPSLASLVGVVLLQCFYPARIVVRVGYHKDLEPPVGPVSRMVVGDVPALLPHAAVRVVKRQLLVNLRREPKCEEEKSRN